MSNPQDLATRLDFMNLDAATQQKLRNIGGVIKRDLPQALDGFYRQIRAFPQTQKFFSGQSAVDSAKSRQLLHWDRIAAGQFDQGYVDAVTKVGQIHARIGLEPRWYIGGYALVIEALAASVVKERWPKGRFGASPSNAGDVAAELGALVKAALLDMDYSISVYLEASEAARKKAEAEIEAVEQAKSTERAKAVGYLAEGMTALTRGDLIYRIPEDIPEEYARIRDDFNGTAERLLDMVTTIKSTTAQIGASAREINSGADDLSTRTEQQASSLQQTAATTEQLAASVKASASSSHEAVLLADEAAKVARTGGDIVRTAIAAMERIEQGARRISDITSVIDGIAFQTNLLALNAAVEAARAGDAGRGFAVVASEVRALAQRSAEAARDISALIKASDAEVLEGVRLVRSAGETLEQIVNASGQVSATVSEISTATAEQANGIGEMSQTVAHMDEITQQNAALSEESAASARSLAQQIEGLNHLVAAFRTDDLANSPAPTAGSAGKQNVTPSDLQQLARQALAERSGKPRLVLATASSKAASGARADWGEF
ncbi:MAG TPA: methyl-accepting chemotaxis protein [Rhizobium sp.]